MSMSPEVTRDQLHRDLGEYARLAGVGYDPSVVDPVLAALDEYWAHAWLAVRTTTHGPDERDVSVRFMDMPAASDAPELLRRAGLLAYSGHPMERLLAGVAAAVPVQWGVDVAVATGVQKVWTSFPDLITVDRLLAIDGMPQAARDHADHLTRWTGNEIALLAVDFVSRTVNLYASIQAPGRIGGADIAAILDGLGFVGADEPELRALAWPYTIYRTFSWESPRVQRICFPARFPREEFPAVDAMLSRFVADGPVAGPGPHGAGFYAAYGPHGKYYKAQADYTSPARFRLPGGAALPQQDRSR